MLGDDGIGNGSCGTSWDVGVHARELQIDPAAWLACIWRDDGVVALVG